MAKRNNQGLDGTEKRTGANICRWMLFGLAILLSGNGLTWGQNNQVLFSSAIMGPSGATSGQDLSGYEFIAAEFELTKDTYIAGVGGDFGGGGPGVVVQEAVIAIDASTGWPGITLIDSGKEMQLKGWGVWTAFAPPLVSAYRDVQWGYNPHYIFPPGQYAVVAFGKFESTYAGFAAENNIPITNTLDLYVNDQWQSIANPGVLLTVYVPEPAYISPFALLALVANRRRAQ